MLLLYTTSLQQSTKCVDPQSQPTTIPNNFKISMSHRFDTWFPHSSQCSLSSGHAYPGAKAMVSIQFFHMYMSACIGFTSASVFFALPDSSARLRLRRQIIKKCTSTNINEHNSYSWQACESRTSKRQRMDQFLSIKFVQQTTTTWDQQKHIAVSVRQTIIDHD